MSPEQEDIVTLVRELVDSLVDDKDAVSVTGEDDRGGVIVNVTVAEDEMGKVIGRQGRVIKAIRTIARTAAIRSNEKVVVEID